MTELYCGLGSLPHLLRMKVTGKNAVNQNGIYVISPNMAITGKECFLKRLLKVSHWQSSTTHNCEAFHRGKT